MTRPTRVKIGAHIYTIEYMDQIVDLDALQKYYGVIDHDRSVITIADFGGERTPSQLLETYLHEAIHGVEAERDLVMDERTVDQLAAALAAIMIDNPDTFPRAVVNQFKPDPDPPPLKCPHY